MKIDALYKKYFQKSKIFLYPLLDIKRGTSVLPEETYISLNDTYSAEDMKFICVYRTRNDSEYINFENEVLLKHTRLHDYTKIDSERTMFIFDFSDIESDWLYIIRGKYSKVDEKVKCKIKNYFDKNSGNYKYVNSFLYPHKYFHEYAKLLDVSVELLISVGELCDPFDLEKEKLEIEVANLQNIKILN